MATSTAPTKSAISVGPLEMGEIPLVAAMHLGTQTIEQTEEARRRGGGRYRFYRDKVRFYAREEPDGILVARMGAGPSDS